MWACLSEFGGVVGLGEGLEGGRRLVSTGGKRYP